jgi:hypothetical protein
VEVIYVLWASVTELRAFAAAVAVAGPYEGIVAVFLQSKRQRREVGKML